MTVISIEELMDARRVVANAIKLDGPVYLPIFERLQNEISHREKDEDLLAQALKIATVH